MAQLLGRVQRLIVEQAPKHQANPAVLEPTPRPSDLAHRLELGDRELGAALQDLGGHPCGRTGGDQFLTQQLAPTWLLLLMRLMLIPCWGFGRISHA
jgi:hypothetical protein